MAKLLKVTNEVKKHVRPGFIILSTVEIYKGKVGDECTRFRRNYSVKTTERFSNGNKISHFLYFSRKEDLNYWLSAQGVSF